MHNEVDDGGSFDFTLRYLYLVFVEIQVPEDLYTVQVPEDLRYLDKFHFSEASVSIKVNLPVATICNQ